MARTGIAPALPIMTDAAAHDTEDARSSASDTASSNLRIGTEINSSAITLIQNHNDLAIQNFRMLLLTAPGERIFLSNFGVGLRNFLFQVDHHTTYNEIESRIRSQTARYLPYISILNIDFKNSGGFGEDDNLLNMSVRIYIKPTRSSALMEVSGLFSEVGVDEMTTATTFL